MFEPENDLERALLQAFASPEAIPPFLRMLLESEVFVVFIPEGSQVLDGKVVIPEGAGLMLATFTHDGERFLPFFTSPSRARAFFGDVFGDPVVAPEKTRDLFERHRDTDLQLNPGTGEVKVFTPDEVERLLAGKFHEAPTTGLVEQSSQVLLAHPKERPEALIAALARELAAVKGVRGAWLMLAIHPDRPEPNWMLGIDARGVADVAQAVDRALEPGDVLDGRLELTLLDRSNPLSSTLRTGIPIVPAKRSFFNLFRS